MEKEWLKVIAASLFELVWVTGLAHAGNFFEWLVTSLGVIGSFYLLTSAIKRLPIGTVYAVFAGLGSIGSILVGTLFFGENLSFLKIIFMITLVGGIIGLKLIETPGDEADQLINQETPETNVVSGEPTVATSTVIEEDVALVTEKLPADESQVDSDFNLPTVEEEMTVDVKEGE